MTLEEFIPEAFRAATGKIPTFTAGSNKWNNLLASANSYIRRWAREPGVDWCSLYDPALDIGSVTTSDTFDLDNSVRALSKQEGDSVRVVHTDGRVTEYTIVDATRLYEYSGRNVVAKIGQTLRFSKAFKSADPQFGGRIIVPIYIYPRKLVRARDKVPVDDPEWLVCMVAADYVRNDITRKDLRADLLEEATNCMLRMREDNEAQSADIYRPWNPLGCADD